MSTLSSDTCPHRNVVIGTDLGDDIITTVKVCKDCRYMLSVDYRKIEDSKPCNTEYEFPAYNFFAKDQGMGHALAWIAAFGIFVSMFVYAVSR